MRVSRKCGDNPWNNRWYRRQNKKPPKYFCTNCFRLFRTGRFSRHDNYLYDDICPNCGAPGLDFKGLAEEYKDLSMLCEEIIKEEKNAPISNYHKSRRKDG